MLSLLRTGSRLSSIAAILGIAACGGGGGDDVAPPSNPPPPPPVTTTSTVAVGTITGFGSIFVNGVEFDTSGATFTIDDNPGVESDLQVGQVVRVSGTIDDNGITGSADDVVFDNEVEGAITSIDVATGEIVVLGQVIVIDAATAFDDRFADPSINGLAVGDLVEVSGFPDASGVIRASRIEPGDANGDLEVRGEVSNLDAANSHFDLNGLTVDYSGATLDDFGGGAPANGDFVEVHGSSVDANGVLIATRVEREDGPLDGVGNDVQVEVEGLITRFASATDFDVAGQPVTTTSGTEFENGDAADLALDVKVEAEGFIDDSGVLVADKVSIRRENDTRIEAVVDDVDADAGTLTVFGIAVTVDDLTRFEDNGDADLRDFSLADLAAGDFVEVRGVETPAGSDAILASELSRDDPDDETTVQGEVDAESPEESLVILGITVQVDAQTQYRDALDNAITAADFFAAVELGTLVEAKGADLGGNVLGAEELEIEVEN
jgi:hypothetical protein